LTAGSLLTYNPTDRRKGLFEQTADVSMTPHQSAITKGFLMMKSILLLLSVLLCLSPLGCQKKEGPAERLGKEIDKSVDEVGSKLGDSISETGKKLGKATEDFKKSIDSFGDKMKSSTGIKDRAPDDSDEQGTNTEDK
jgi:hypothetical protein